MSPLKHTMNDDDSTGEMGSVMNTSMDEGSHCSESITVSSPPRSLRSFSASRLSGGGFGSAASRLFSDDEEEEDEDNHTGPVLKSMDLNMVPLTGTGTGTSLDGSLPLRHRPTTTAGSHGDRGSRTPFRNRGGHKRQAERQMVARDLSFDDDANDTVGDESPTDMMLQSPRISPSGYRSPFRVAASTSTVLGSTTSTMGSINKSPCYRTMDGRTVQSKNPFSPMYTDESASACVSSRETQVPLADSLTFPVSLEISSSNEPGLAGPLLRHRLQKRDTNAHPFAFPSFEASAAAQYYTRDGYPERQGRYSFTGSPIRETNMETEQASQNDTMSLGQPMLNMSGSTSSIPHKVRRRSEQEDIPAAASSVTSESSFYASLSNRGSLEPPAPLEIDDINFGRRSSDHSLYEWVSNISPTDVLDFPPSTPVPPTPSKPAKGRPITHKYTPVRKPSVPPTPMPERRHHQWNSNVEESVGHSSQQQQQQPSSRFYSDFDVIGELGNGSFGNVFKVMSRLDGCMYAIKVAHRPAKGMADKDRMLKEVSWKFGTMRWSLSCAPVCSLNSRFCPQVYALAALSDQPDIATFHIVRYHQAWMEEQRLYIQTELCTSTLSTEIQHISPVLLSVPRRYKFLREMCLALEFIHKNGMVHLDIKPENVFVKNDQFKLGDFGLVSKVSSHDVEEGDSRYMSMELLSGDHSDLTKSDIFSLGISLYEICLGGVRTLPTNGPEWQSLRAAQFHSLANTPDDMQVIMKQMMDPNVGSRPSASDLLKRPHLLSEEQKALLEEQKKVAEANLALAERSHLMNKFQPSPTVLPGIPPRTALRRSNTWNGF